MGCSHPEVSGLTTSAGTFCGIPTQPACCRGSQGIAGCLHKHCRQTAWLCSLPTGPSSVSHEPKKP